jgi:cell division protein FtsQ
VLAGAVLAALAIGGYVVARQSAAFAIDRVEVTGAPPGVHRQVMRALAPFRGASLLGLDGGALERRLASLPTVVSARYDRAFPHTLRVQVVPETPVAALRRGAETWLVSARGRVIGPLVRGAEPALARIWVKRSAPVARGGFLAPGGGGAAARALALAARFPARIAAVSLNRDGLVFRLRSGLDLRLGEPTDVRLKLAIARRALGRLPAGSAYLDVSVPGRPVAGPDPKVSGGG